MRSKLSRKSIKQSQTNTRTVYLSKTLESQAADLDVLCARHVSERQDFIIVSVSNAIKHISKTVGVKSKTTTASPTRGVNN